MCLFPEREKNSVIAIYGHLFRMHFTSGDSRLALLSGPPAVFTAIYMEPMFNGNGDSVLFPVQWNQGDIQEDFLLCLLSSAHMDTFCHRLFYSK